ncbi:retrotransposon protein, putative, ty1-copia subclass [Tanacetum coccineum]|uniref:Retrotransposon protein, putative, ty1-copia subclass n=1 Tax=Tanacetum coccineum TaxID=301880 RepID=A0ABQ5DZZ0_9ASTR
MYANLSVPIRLKQASRQWNKRFDDEIKKFGFTQNPDEPCVYLKASGSYVAILILYVDDILLMGNNIPIISSHTKGNILVNGGNLKRQLRDSATADVDIYGSDNLKSQTGIYAEYIAAFDASKEAVWIRKFISGVGIVPNN